MWTGACKGKMLGHGSCNLHHHSAGNLHQRSHLLIVKIPHSCDCGHRCRMKIIRAATAEEGNSCSHRLMLPQRLPHQCTCAPTVKAATAVTCRPEAFWLPGRELPTLAKVSFLLGPCRGPGETEQAVAFHSAFHLWISCSHQGLNPRHFVRQAAL